MAQTLVTGGNGFIGSHVVRELARRGDKLRLLVRQGRELDHLAGVDYELVNGDVRDADDVRRAVEGVDRVFHLAGTTSMRRGARGRVFEVNAGGTRNVMEAALHAGVERVVHTSTVATMGPPRRGGIADESWPYAGSRLRIPYIDSKREAEVIALQTAARGLPLVCVNPSFVFGPDDPKGTSNRLIRRFLLRRIPIYVAGGLNVVDVRDVARGFLLADERGREGERYILAGRNFTLQRLFADLARISGAPPPVLRVPGRLAVGWVEALERAGLPMPTSSAELRSGLEFWWYRNNKAVDELGFAPRPHEETLEDAVRWQLDQLGDRIEGRRLADLALRAAGGAARLPARLSLPGR